jgi:hypothetical protein
MADEIGEDSSKKGFLSHVERSLKGVGILGSKVENHIELSDKQLLNYAPKSVGVFNLQDVNGPEFWFLWTRVGGSADEYIKETLPNYSLIGALLLTISIPLTIFPPDTIKELTQDDDSSLLIFFFMISACLSIASSLVMTILSGAIYQQYVNCYSKDLRIHFAAQYGFAISIFSLVLYVSVFSLFISLIIVYSTLYDLKTVIVSAVILLGSSVFTLVFYVRMTSWNSTAYLKQMVVDLNPSESSSSTDVSSTSTSTNNNPNNNTL